MELNREQIEKSKDYVEDVLKNWALWQTHHSKLTQSMRDMLVLIEVYEQEIKELTEEKDTWEAIAKSYQKQFEDCGEDRAKLTEENERLRGELREANKDKQILFDEIASLEAEAEKAIDIAEGNIRAEIASCGTSCHWCEDKVKADTVKEMQERLKDKSSHICTVNGVEEVVDVWWIDQIAKEMLEVNDEK